MLIASPWMSFCSFSSLPRPSLSSKSLFKVPASSYTLPRWLRHCLPSPKCIPLCTSGQFANCFVHMSMASWLQMKVEIRLETFSEKQVMSHWPHLSEFKWTNEQLLLSKAIDLVRCHSDPTLQLLCCYGEYLAGPQMPVCRWAWLYCFHQDKLMVFLQEMVCNKELFISPNLLRPLVQSSAEINGILWFEWESFSIS